jgi:O-antigen ligase
MAWLKPLSVRAVRTPAVPAILPTFSANLPDQLERLASGILLGGLCLIPAFLGLGLHEPFEFGKFFLLSLLALILVALQGAAILIRGRGVSLRPLLALEWSVLGLVCTSALSAFFSLSPSSSWGWSHQSCIGWWAIVSLMVLVFSVRNLFATPSRQRQLFMAMALSGLVPALYGVLQWLRLDPWEWSQMTLMSGEQRIFGTLGHPNHLGAFLVVLLPWVVHQSRTASTDYGRSLWVSVGLLYSMAIVGTYSRIAWVGLAMVILGTLTLIISRYRVLTGAVSLGVMLFLVMTIPSLRERALGVVQFESRQEIWSAAVQISRDYPITGCGLHSFGSAFGVYRSAAFEVNEWNVTPFHAHNELLHLFAT